MDASKRKELMDAYKSRVLSGGVYCIECSGNNRKWIKSTTDMEGAKNRFNFSMSIKSCPEPSMRREWNEYGIDSFSFVVLEELRQKETQTSEEFADDIKVLHEIWIDKCKQED